MNRTMLVTTFAALTLSTTAALADDVTTPPSAPSTAASESGKKARPERAVELGLRVGYAIPLGDAAKDAKLSDTLSGVLPIQIDAGYKINPNLLVGAYFQYGIGFPNSDNCDGCSGSDVRLGVQAHYHFIPDGPFDPWAGVGIGYEWMSIGKDDASATAKGFEFANLQVGGDYRVSPNFGIGPFAQFNLAQYSSTSVSNGSQDQSADIEDKSMHFFLTLGVRDIYDLGI